LNYSQAETAPQSEEEQQRQQHQQQHNNNTTTMKSFFLSAFTLAAVASVGLSMEDPVEKGMEKCENPGIAPASE
jgi:hypothetical protein